MLAEATRATFLALVDANRAQREPATLAKLCLGLKCGGSDGFSGITANPALGHVSDLMAALGGTTRWGESWETKPPSSSVATKMRRGRASSRRRDVRRRRSSRSRKSRPKRMTPAGG